jgi:hypothetical protein
MHTRSLTAARVQRKHLLCYDEGEKVPDVHRSGGRTSASVQKERLLLLHPVEYRGDVTVGKEDFSSDQVVERFVAARGLETLEEIVGQLGATESL